MPTLVIYEQVIDGSSLSLAGVTIDDILTRR
jgi:hypothetical protein